ncbi:phospholipase D family protein [Sedimentimonas flavescens]|uniref:phospholipase D family protein n=1 Tax=Sedimentimonas flavescens TaxID=2851012 RepID=UPI0021A34847|nr:phospholipase D family protein [Sedimentimonas flavescens]MCT2538761.1 phospholipase D family protein [Sedimentimonas flavescens]
MPERTALDPANRRLYSDILRAPPGYAFDAAVATTYSLDFETALTVPATLAFQAAEARAQLLDTPLALLEGLERLAGRMAIFCEAGRIKAVPKNPNCLTALLEDTITEVLAPKGGAFHPKLWLLRFNALDDPGAVVLRLAILSRNLTTDQSWDLSLVLDGRISSEPDDNRALVLLLSALPGLTPRGATPKRSRDLITSMIETLEQVRWTRPEGVSRIAFHVNGLGATPWRPLAGRGLTVISPFVSADALEHLTQGVAPEAAQLVSRAEELARIPGPVLARFGKVLVLDEMAETEDGEECEAEDASLSDQPPRRGLHAKAFVTERYSSTEITMGSGNATNAALLSGANVEIFATLTGSSRALGGREEQLDAKAALGKFLSDYQGISPTDRTGQNAAEKRLDMVRAEIVRAGLTLACTSDGDERIALRLSSAHALVVPEGIEMMFWPLMAGAAQGTKLIRVGPEAQPLGALTLRDVTRWLGVRLRDLETGLALEFSLGARLEDLPEGRDKAILRARIADRGAFLRYMQLLLADPGGAAQAFLNATKDGAKRPGFGAFGEVPLLEAMVKALSGEGKALDDVERLIARLGDACDAAGDPLIPPEFLTLWESFRTLRQASARRSRKGSRQ